MNDSPPAPAKISLSADRPTGPGLSIMVPTYNRRELLANCLKSLLPQTDPGTPLKILVVDDGSNVGTDRVRLPHRRAGYPSATRAGGRRLRGSTSARV
jgi:cellulose synthase/poly-beta-1,6-N-acetylglucosamine synthase-like glycosyltransferase